MADLQKLKIMFGNIPHFKQRMKKGGLFGNNLEATQLTNEQLEVIKNTYGLKAIKVNLTGIGCSIYDEKMQNNPKEPNEFKGMVFELFSVNYTLDHRIFFKGKLNESINNVEIKTFKG